MRVADPCIVDAIVKLCYRNASVRALKPSRIDMEKVRGDLQTLYQREDPHTPGLPLATHVEPAKANNEIPSEAEVEAEVRRLRPHRAGGHTNLCAEHLNQWRREE